MLVAHEIIELSTTRCQIWTLIAFRVLTEGRHSLQTVRSSSPSVRGAGCTGTLDCRVKGDGRESELMQIFDRVYQSTQSSERMFPRKSHLTEPTVGSDENAKENSGGLDMSL